MGNKNIEINLLQYVDNAIFMGDATLDNVLVMKSIMRCHEMISRLKVKFFSKVVLEGLGWMMRGFKDLLMF